MPLPTLSRIWRFQVSQLVAAQASATLTAARMMRQIKDGFLGLGSWTDSLGSAAAAPATNWTVMASSNASAAGYDGVDRWATDADLVWASSSNPRSWIVLRNAGIAPKFELCVQLDALTAPLQRHASFVVSPGAGFGAANGGTNGSTTARPTATDEIVIQAGSSGVQWGSSGGNVASRYHLLRSSDGYSNRLFITRNNFVCSAWVFEKPQHPVDGWANPSVCGVHAQDNDSPTSSVTTMGNFNGGIPRLHGRVSANMQMLMTCEGAGISANNSIAQLSVTANELSGELPLLVPGLWSTTLGQRGRHGVLADLWWGALNQPAISTYPDAPPAELRQFIHFGDWVLPWNRSVPLFTN